MGKILLKVSKYSCFSVMKGDNERRLDYRDFFQLFLEYKIMRCPKCGYTSFDNLERCKRCKKTISATATALMGTVLDAFPPSFLLDSDEDGAPQEELAAAAAGPSLAKESDDATFNLAGSSEEATTLDDGGADLRLSESGTGPTAQEPAMDVDLNLSGAESSAPGGADFSLEDLHIEDDMGLEKTPVPTPASTGDRLSPSAKTGTALDGFNIEQLDDLLVADKAEKA